LLRKTARCSIGQFSKKTLEIEMYAIGIVKEITHLWRNNGFSVLGSEVKGWGRGRGMGRAGEQRG